MFMMQPHRRSDRRPKNNTMNTEAEARVQAFIKANRVEATPGKVYRRKNEENDDLPQHIDGFDYNKEMYLANDRYATMVDNDLAEFIKEKLWKNAQEEYAKDTFDHGQTLKDE